MSAHPILWTLAAVVAGVWLFVQAVDWWNGYQIRRWRRRGER